MNKSSYFKKKKKKNKETKFSKKALGLGALGSYFLGFFQKKKKFKIFNSLKKFKISKFFKKKKKNQSKFSIPWKNSRLPNFSKKKEGNFQKGPWD